MKITFDQSLPSDKKYQYSYENRDQYPTQIKHLLEIEGIKGIFHVSDFMAIERTAKGDWATILQKVKAVFGDQNSASLQEKKVRNKLILLVRFRFMSRNLKGSLCRLSLSKGMKKSA